MGSFNPKELDIIVWNNNIYTYDKIDRVIGGIDGTSNKPVIDLSQNSHYLKKYKGNILRGTLDPNTDPDVLTYLNSIDLDNLTPNHILYFKEDDMSVWTIDKTSYLETVDSITWLSQYDNYKLNVKGVELNGDGNKATYIYFDYDSDNEVLKIKDENGDLADLQVKDLNFNVYGSGSEITKLEDNEILLLSHITNSSQNQDAFYSVKRLEDTPLTITGFERNIDGGQTGTDDDYDLWHIDGDINPNLVVGDFIQISNITEGVGDDINGYYRVLSSNDQTGFNYIKTDRNFKVIEASSDQPTGLNGIIQKDNAVSIKWDNDYDNGTGEDPGIWTLIDKDNNLLPLKVSGLQIDGQEPEFLNLFINTIITNEAEFNLFFNNGNIVRSNEKVFVKHNPLADYTLSNNIIIEGDNLHIEFGPGVEIDLNGYSVIFNNNTGTQENIIFKGGIWYDSTTGGSLNGYYFDLSNSINSKLEDMVIENCEADKCIIGNSSMEFCNINNIKLDSNSNIFNILIDNIYNSNLMEVWLENTDTGKELLNIYNSNFVGFLNGESTIYNT
jgi:hypothetical protein